MDDDRSSIICHGRLGAPISRRVERSADKGNEGERERGEVNKCGVGPSFSALRAASMPVDCILTVPSMHRDADCPVLVGRGELQVNSGDGVMRRTNE